MSAAIISAINRQYFIYENRLASFNAPRPVPKQRASSASSRVPKTLQWPHKALSPVEFAKAGFYFKPHPDSPDNVVCFLCQKNMDGWEDDDKPLVEHLRHSEDCAWALTAAVEAEMPEYVSLHPLESRMLNARKATFAGRWPHEAKKGFKCKTKQLAEAGWKYTPTAESDDMATCVYCQLALDGWDPADKPTEEHYKRSPNCPFFALLNVAPVPAKKGRSKVARSSKASRLSAQSIATAPSVGDMTVDHAEIDDSVMTASSVTTQGVKKGRVRKAPVAKGRKTRAKKDDPVEIHEDEPQDVEMPPPPPPKPVRARKRASDAMEESVMTNSEAPAPKKRATRAKVSAGLDSSVLTSVDAEVAHTKQAAGRKKTVAGPAKTTRKVSQSSLRSQASTASLRGRGRTVVEDELDRQLQADLDRPLTDDEDMMVDSGSEKEKAPAPAPARGRSKKGTNTRKVSAQSQKQAKTGYAMFDPTPVGVDDHAVDVEMKALEAEVAEGNIPAKDDVLPVPKKGRKVGTRQVSKQTKKVQDQASASTAVDDAMEDALPAAAPGPATAAETSKEHDMTFGSVVAKEAGEVSNLPKAGDCPPQNTQASVVSTTPEGSPPRSSYLHPRTEQVDTGSAGFSVSCSAVKRTPVKVDVAPTADSGSPTPVRVPTTATPSRSAKPEGHLPPPRLSANRVRTATTPRGAAAASGKSTTPLSPSQSPQASDAENQPPSSKPSHLQPHTQPQPYAQPPVTTKKRVMVLDPPVDPTPARNLSPMRRNVVAGLRSATPWTAADVELVFSSSRQEKAEGDDVSMLLPRSAELTSPEKRMTIEEWIYHNAGLAEQKLRHECEAMVSAFESEGSRAMRVLEDIIVD